MALIKLLPRPGIVRETTDYANEGGWYDCDKVRFQFGVPVKIGGWQKLTSEAAQGTIRALYDWVTLDGTDYMAIGTAWKYYIENGGTLTDITPLRATETLGTDPFDATDGSDLITVNLAGHDAYENDFVTFSGATTFAGIPAADINTNLQVVERVDGNSFTVRVATAASSTASGGGAAVEAAFEINVGLDVGVAGVGFGAGTWGHDAWGSDADILLGTTNLRLWTQDNFGEDLLINARNSAIYYWDVSDPTARAVNLSLMAGASDAPVAAIEIMVSDNDRQVIAFGCNPIDDSAIDRLLIRYSDTEDALNWTPSTVSTAGDLRLSYGSEIITALQTRQEILVWTDVSLHSMQSQPPPFVYGVNLIGANISIMGPLAKTVYSDVVFWMGKDQFYAYDGSIRVLPCTVRDYVFGNLNFEQQLKVCCGVNQNNNEIIWFYPSAASEENDRYVIYNTQERVWYFGELSRTVYLDRGIDDYPKAASTDGYVYYHEVGWDDGSTNPPTAINAYITSSPIELSMQDAPNGERFIFARRLIPDITFDGSTVSAPALTITLTPRNYPGAAMGTEVESAITRSSGSSAVVETYTEQVPIRLRGRSVIMKVESTALGVAWRAGAQRIDGNPDGRR